MSSYATIDNYDYAFNWILGQDGSIEVEVMLTGLMNFRNTPQQKDDGAAHLDHLMFGHLVANRVDAPNHQHFFCFRLDFDIDGAQNNAVLELNTESAKPGKDNPRGEWFSMTEHPLKTEQEAQRNLNLATSRKWKIVNLKTTNGLGQLTGYTLMPGENSVPFQSPESDARQKAGFINSHLWVTRYSPDEMFASGEYVNLGHRQEGAGLDKSESADRRPGCRGVVHAGSDTHSAHRRLAAHACAPGRVSLAAIEFLLTQPCAGAVSILSKAVDSIRLR